MRVFSVYFWHSEGWTPRNEALLEAVLKRARIIQRPWLVACEKLLRAGQEVLQRARTVHWKKWAAKHEYDELKEFIWLEPALALLRKKTKEDWIEMHRNVARKLLLEGRWVQQTLFDIGLSDESECQACHKEKGTEKHRLHHCPEEAKGGSSG